MRRTGEVFLQFRRRKQIIYLDFLTRDFLCVVDRLWRRACQVFSRR